jgi:hypothetical protein
MRAKTAFRHKFCHKLVNYTTVITVDKASCTPIARSNFERLERQLPQVSDNRVPLIKTLSRAHDSNFQSLALL